MIGLVMMFGWKRERRKQEIEGVKKYIRPAFDAFVMGEVPEGATM